MPAKLNWNLSGAGADVKNRILAVPARQEIRRESPIDLRMIHQVIIMGLLGRIHHLGLENARQHGIRP